MIDVPNKKWSTAIYKYTVDNLVSLLGKLHAPLINLEIFLVLRERFSKVENNLKSVILDHW